MLKAFFKILSSNRLLLKIIRFLKLNQIMKNFYFIINTLGSKKKKVNFMGISANFQISNYYELKSFEKFSNASYSDERRMLGALLEFLNDGDVAYDVGANIGFYTLIMAKKVGVKGKIIAFEPDSENLIVLNKNVKINNLDNVRVINVALGDKIGEGSLYIKKKIGIGSISLIEGKYSNFRKTTKIIPGDYIVAGKNPPLPKAIKIDVEGYEYLVLKGLKKTLSSNHCRLVCCEIHPTLFTSGITKEDVLNLLNSYGFKEIKTYTRGSETHAVCYKGKT